MSKNKLKMRIVKIDRNPKLLKCKTVILSVCFDSHSNFIDTLY